MEFVIGATKHAQPSRSKAPELSGPGGTVEARVLNVRPGRSGQSSPPSGIDNRRRGERYYDPSSGSVLMLLIPDGTKLPRDIESDHYRVFVRISNK
jgi:hypothetical protein